MGADKSPEISPAVQPQPRAAVRGGESARQGAPAPVAEGCTPQHRLDLILELRRAEAAAPGRITAKSDMSISPCSAAGCPSPRTRTGLRQPPETALGAPEALRSPLLVTQAPNTLSLIGYYSFFMKPSRLLPSSLGKTFAASFCNYISLVFVMAQK